MNAGIFGIISLADDRKDFGAVFADSIAGDFTILDAQVVRCKLLDIRGGGIGK